ncbi:YncE family protein [Saccharopolyspora sp. NPDC050389]|uniref:YncE family protein n=1 Tax=Saccharopolyspora sp. NPDC050389 TaxID=3155516 RepID=UPI0033EB3795
MVTRRAVIKGIRDVAAVAAVAPSAIRAAQPAAPSEGDVLAVVEKSSHAVSFYDTSTGRRQDSIALPHYPHELAADSRRRLGYVGHYGVRMSSDTGEGGAAVFVLDLAARKLIRTVDLRPFNRIHGVGTDARDRLYALSEAKATLLGFDDPPTDQEPTRAVPTDGVKTHLFAISRDGERAYVTGLLSHTVSLVRPYDPVARPVVMTPGERPEGLCLSHDERTLYVGARRSHRLVALDAHRMTVRTTVPVPGDPLRVYARPDGVVLMTDIADNSLTAFTPDLRRLWSLRLPGTPSAVSFHPNAALAYVSQLGGGDQVSIVDLESRSIVGGFTTGREPDSSVLLPAT